MKTLWIIECTGYSPSVYISANGGLTGKPEKTMQFRTRKEAEAKIVAMKLSATWEAVARNFPGEHGA